MQKSDAMLFALPHSERALEVFVRRDGTTRDRPRASTIVTQFATVTMYVVSDHLTDLAIEEAFQKLHLAWDSEAQRCVWVSATSKAAAGQRAAALGQGPGVGERRGRGPAPGRFTQPGSG